MIKSVTTNGQTFAVGRCVPGIGSGPVIARISEGIAPGCYSCFDKDRHLIARINNCPTIAVYEKPTQKEAPESATL